MSEATFIRLAGALTDKQRDAFMKAWQAGSGRAQHITQEDAWLPIATAPTDGTPVLLWSPETHTYVHFGRYWGQNSRWEEDAEHTPSCPTHWMPLPAPPATP